tara:strand:- start:2173 stop:2352 length:180 start_codon:yes stop_codon:yes gene_type:complete
MATYDYNCSRCKADKEIVHGMTESPTLNCLVCDTELVKVIRNTSFHLKGKGWFKSPEGE